MRDENFTDTFVRLISLHCEGNRRTHSALISTMYNGRFLNRLGSKFSPHFSKLRVLIAKEGTREKGSTRYRLLLTAIGFAEGAKLPDKLRTMQDINLGCYY